MEPLGVCVGGECLCIYITTSQPRVYLSLEINNTGRSYGLAPGLIPRYDAIEGNQDKPNSGREASLQSVDGERWMRTYDFPNAKSTVYYLSYIHLDL